jgi:periplasmic divalent cation tolerance protein
MRDGESSSPGAGEVVVALITTPPDDARRIAEALLDRGLAACCNVIPSVTSIFNWEGARQNETEALIVVKTARSCAPALTAAVKAIHPYDVPEVLLLGVYGGLEEYLKWVVRECETSERKD